MAHTMRKSPSSWRKEWRSADQQQADEDKNEGEAHQGCYHPDENKDAFYYQLQAELESTPCHES